MVPPESQVRRARVLAGAIAAAVTVIAWIHLGIHSPQPYSVHGDEYVEHAWRVSLAVELAQGAWAHPIRFLRSADTDFPPGIHLVGVPLGVVFGHAAERIMWAWMGWVALLGISLAWVVRSLGGPPSARAAAFASAFLIPAVPASATRYHFDLPMLVLTWLAFAVALGTWDRPPRRDRLIGGALTGLAVFGAVLMKWTAVPFVACALAGAFLAHPRDPVRWTDALRRRLPAVGAAAVVAGALIAGFLAISSKSLDQMSLTFTFGEALPGSLASFLALLPAPIARGLTRVAVQAPLLPQWLSYYALSAVFAIYSVPVALAVAVPGLRWLATDRRGAVALGVFLVGGLAFLTLSVPIADARFLLPLAPIPMLAAVLGWSTLGPRLRWTVGALGVVAALAVTADFHLAVWPGNHEGQIVWRRDLGPGSADVEHRGLGLASSTNDRGWVRRDEARPHRHAFRQALWQTRAACSAGALAVSTDLVTYGADRYWWSYQAGLARLADPDGAVTLPPGEICEMQSPEVDIATVLFVTASSPADRLVPACLAEVDARWRWEGWVPDPDGGPGAAVFVLLGTPSCAAGIP